MSKNNGKHLTTTQRLYIEKGLMEGKSFSAIAREIDKHPSTVNKEVKKHRFFPERKKPDKKIICYRRDVCSIRFLCGKTDCYKQCKICYNNNCNRDCKTICPEYKPKVCVKVQKAPFVCNGCPKLKTCNLQHAL